MLRIFFLALVPLFLPAFAYAGYRIYRQYKTVGLQREIDWSDAPWHWLIAGGIGLMAIVLIIVSLFGQGDAGDEYHPPKYIDGKIVPGRIVPKTK